MVDAYAYEGDALFVQITRERLPKYGWSASMLCSSVCPDDSGGYEFVVIGWWQYEPLLHDHVAVESPRSGGLSHDKCALKVFSELQLAGYEVLAWRPYCKEAMPYMDRDGNTLPIEEQPPLKRRIQVWPSFWKGYLTRWPFLLRRRSKYFELKTVMLQKEIDKTDRFTDFEMVFDLHKDEKDRNDKSGRLVEIDSDAYGAWDRVKMADMAIGRAMVEMDAAELNLLGRVRNSPEI
ncbi:uncharacterized protein FPRN_12004 [Fusarium proliferatum]|nr:uncharacterized protein FPRN_12004 [Fusarium proliferatum]